MVERRPIERAARAVEAAIFNPALRASISIDCDDPARVHRQIARAVIAAIRDSEDLAALVAGKQALYSCSEDPELADARGCFQAMIDAMLKET